MTAIFPLKLLDLHADFNEVVTAEGKSNTNQMQLTSMQTWTCRAYGDPPFTAVVVFLWLRLEVVVPRLDPAAKNQTQRP